MGERRGTKALELWCRRITDGYPGVNVQNMTTSWKDGLAFCAMIHHFRPELIDFSSLDKHDVYGNNELAFRTAEQYLGIPALLDAEDMASCSVPDRLSILTYLSQFYQTFGGSSQNCRPLNETTEIISGNITEVSESPPKKVQGSGIRRDTCSACGLPVFLAEKLVIAHVVYHRTCFRCARCNNQLTLGNYYETEEGQYCCETCPDEASPSPSVHMSNSNATSLSDISRSTVKEDTVTEYQEAVSDESSIEKKPVNQNSIKTLQQQEFPIPDLIAQTSQLRLNFISNHLLSEEGEKVLSTDASLVSGNASELEENASVISETEEGHKIKAAISDDDKYARKKDSEETGLSNASVTLDTQSSEKIIEKTVEDSENEESWKLETPDTLKTDEAQKLSISSDVQSDKDNSTSLIVNVDDSKMQVRELERQDSESHLSLVQKRLKMFESQDAKSRVKKKDYEHRSVDILRSDTCDSAVVIDDKLAESLTSDLETVQQQNEILDNEETKDFAADATSLVDCETVDTIELNDSECTSNSNVVDSSKTEEYPEDLNPFSSDEEDSVSQKHQASLGNPKNEGLRVQQVEGKDEKNTVLPKPAARSNVKNDKLSQLVLDVPIKRRLPAPKINLNPFWSDDDEYDDDLVCKGNTAESTPVPKPRTNKRSLDAERNGQATGLNSSDLYTSSSSLSNFELGIGAESTCRKKKHAPPPPPNIKELHSSDECSLSASRSLNSSAGYLDVSPRTTPRPRKTKPAPPPPMPTSTPCNTTGEASLNFEDSSIVEAHDTSKSTWENLKTNKDEANKNRKSLTHVSSEEHYDHKTYLDKSTQGKWKRKKGPAPACPIPHRRKIKVMSLKDVKMELEQIELQQQGLERQGVRLEQLIRSKYESEPNNEDAFHGTDVEELILELFSLVNEKNELFRRQAELMLLRRQQRLEEEHADVEYQIRCLMSKHESTKTDFDKQKEEAMIQRLVEIVERRNEIVECLEMDRRREIEEDRSIHKHLGIFAAKNKTAICNNDVADRPNSSSKKNKSKGKTKEKKSKKLLKKDMDKDIDETELKQKRHSKRKWF